MKTDVQQADERDGGGLSRYDYTDATVFVADFGTDIGDATVDAVDGTAIVVAESGAQFEFELPTSEATPTIRNGVLTIEVAR